MRNGANKLAAHADADGSVSLSERLTRGSVRVAFHRDLSPLHLPPTITDPALPTQAFDLIESN